MPRFYDTLLYIAVEKGNHMISPEMLFTYGKFIVAKRTHVAQGTLVFHLGPGETAG